MARLKHSKPSINHNLGWFWLSTSGSATFKSLHFQNAFILSLVLTNLSCSVASPTGNNTNTTTVLDSGHVKLIQGSASSSFPEKDHLVGFELFVKRFNRSEQTTMFVSEHIPDNVFPKKGEIESGQQLVIFPGQTEMLKAPYKNVITYLVMREMSVTDLENLNLNRYTSHLAYLRNFTNEGVSIEWDVYLFHFHEFNGSFAAAFFGKRPGPSFLVKGVGAAPTRTKRGDDSACSYMSRMMGKCGAAPTAPAPAPAPPRQAQGPRAQGQQPVQQQGRGVQSQGQASPAQSSPAPGKYNSLNSLYSSSQTAQTPPQPPSSSLFSQPSQAGQSPAPAPSSSTSIFSKMYSSPSGTVAPSDTSKPQLAPAPPKTPPTPSPQETQDQIDAPFDEPSAAAAPTPPPPRIQPAPAPSLFPSLGGMNSMNFLPVRSTTPQAPDAPEKRAKPSWSWKTTESPTVPLGRKISATGEASTTEYPMYGESPDSESLDASGFPTHPPWSEFRRREGVTDPSNEFGLGEPPTTFGPKKLTCFGLKSNCGGAERPKPKPAVRRKCAIGYRCRQSSFVDRFAVASTSTTTTTTVAPIAPPIAPSNAPLIEMPIAPPIAPPNSPSIEMPIAPPIAPPNAPSIELPIAPPIGLSITLPIAPILPPNSGDLDIVKIKNYSPFSNSLKLASGVIEEDPFSEPDADPESTLDSNKRSDTKETLAEADSESAATKQDLTELSESSAELGLNPVLNSEADANSDRAKKKTDSDPEDMERLRVPYVGVGSCPYTSALGVSERNLNGTREGIVDFFLKILRVDCEPNFKERTLQLFESELVKLKDAEQTFEVSLNREHPLCTKKIMGELEWMDFLSGVYISTFSRVYASQLTIFDHSNSDKIPKENVSPGGTSISGTAMTLTHFSFEILELMHTTEKPHAVKMANMLLIAIQGQRSELATTQEDLEKCEKCLLEKEINFNDHMQLFTLMKLIVDKLDDIVSLKRDKFNLKDSFKKFYEENFKLISGYVTNKKPFIY